MMMTSLKQFLKIEDNGKVLRRRVLGSRGRKEERRRWNFQVCPIPYYEYNMLECEGGGGNRKSGVISRWVREFNVKFLGLLETKYENLSD